MVEWKCWDVREKLGRIQRIANCFYETACTESRHQLLLNRSGRLIPPLFLDLRRSSHFCEIVVNFYAVLSKRARFSKAPSLKNFMFSLQGAKGFYHQFLDFSFGEVKLPI